MTTTPFGLAGCPQCGELVGTVARHTWATAAKATAIFLALAALWLLLVFSPLHLLIALVAAATAAAFVAAVIYGATAPFAKNRCKACGHRWR